MQIQHSHYAKPQVIHALVIDDYGNLISLNDLQAWYEDCAAALKQAVHHIDGYFYIYGKYL